MVHGSFHRGPHVRKTRKKHFCEFRWNCVFRLLVSTILEFSNIICYGIVIDSTEMCFLDEHFFVRRLECARALQRHSKHIHVIVDRIPRIDLRSREVSSCSATYSITNYKLFSWDSARFLWIRSTVFEGKKTMHFHEHMNPFNRKERTNSIRRGKIQYQNTFALGKGRTSVRAPSIRLVERIFLYSHILPFITKNHFNIWMDAHFTRRKKNNQNRIKRMLSSLNC